VKQAMVFVLLEIDPRIPKSDIEDDPELLRTLTKQANLMSDQMLKTNHPDALILRVEG
jgi:hypothetical protein